MFNKICHSKVASVSNGHHSMVSAIVPALTTVNTNLSSSWDWLCDAIALELQFNSRFSSLVFLSLLKNPHQVYRLLGINAQKHPIFTVPRDSFHFISIFKLMCRFAIESDGNRNFISKLIDERERFYFDVLFIAWNWIWNHSKWYQWMENNKSFSKCEAMWNPNFQLYSRFQFNFNWMLLHVRGNSSSRNSSLFLFFRENCAFSRDFIILIRNNGWIFRWLLFLIGRSACGICLFSKRICGFTSIGHRHTMTTGVLTASHWNWIIKLQHILHQIYIKWPFSSIWCSSRPHHDLFQLVPFWILLLPSLWLLLLLLLKQNDSMREMVNCMNKRNFFVQ